MSFPPARFKRPTLLIVGCGDIGLRVAKRLRHHWRVLALTTSAERAPALRAAGNDAQFQRLVETLGVPALAREYPSNALRLGAGDSLTSSLAAATSEERWRTNQ